MRVRRSLLSLLGLSITAEALLRVPLKSRDRVAVIDSMIAR
jgi:hypothetical protein